jgi:hypothetical protein
MAGPLAVVISGGQGEGTLRIYLKYQFTVFLWENSELNYGSNHSFIDSQLLFGRIDAE